MLVSPDLHCVVESSISRTVSFERV